MSEQTVNVSSENGAVRIDAGLTFHKVIDFDRAGLRKALKSSAGLVIKAARRLVSRNAISAAGDFPGKDTGTLRRHIGIVKTGGAKGGKNPPPGGYVRVGVTTIKGQVFYPAVLYYGSQKRNIARRGNYIVEAASSNRDAIRSKLRAGLIDSLKPR